jgi:tetratricopeptide (TPR) repeat protein
VNDRNRLELLPELGYGLMLSGEFDRCRDVFSEATAGAAATGEEVLLARARTLEIGLRWWHDPTFTRAEMVAITSEVIPVLERSGDLFELAIAWLARAATEGLELRYDDELRSLGRALEQARASGDTRMQAELTLWMGGALISGTTPIPDALDYLEGVYESIPTHGDGREVSPWLKLMQLMNSARLHAMRGEFDTARRQSDEWMALGRELGIDIVVAGNSAGPAEIELLAGDPAAAELVLVPAYAELQRAGAHNGLPYIAGLLARALCEQERYDEGAPFATVFRENARPDDRSDQAASRAIEARVLACLGDAEKAEGLAREALGLVEGTEALILHAETLLDLAEVLRLAGRSEEAAPLVARALSLYEQKGVVPGAARARRLLAAAAA